MYYTCPYSNMLYEQMEEHKNDTRKKNDFSLHMISDGLTTPTQLVLLITHLRAQLFIVAGLCLTEPVIKSLLPYNGVHRFWKSRNKTMVEQIQDLDNTWANDVKVV